MQIFADEGEYLNNPYLAAKDTIKMESGKPFFPEWISGERAFYAQGAQGVYNIWFSQCFHCKEFAVWIDRNLIWPRQRGAPLPNPDLPDDVRSNYEEASNILDLSPRGAAALLRLGIQKLCKHLGGKGNAVNDDISLLVKKGLRVEIQQALDAIRVIGNNAVHPGQLDLQDDHATARSLFGLVNLIASVMISEPKRVSEIYENLPEGAREAIERRDARQVIEGN